MRSYVEQRRSADRTARVDVPSWQGSFARVLRHEGWGLDPRSSWRSTRPVGHTDGAARVFEVIQRSRAQARWPLSLRLVHVDQSKTHSIVWSCIVWSCWRNRSEPATPTGSARIALPSDQIPLRSFRKVSAASSRAGWPAMPRIEWAFRLRCVQSATTGHCGR